MSPGRATASQTTRSERPARCSRLPMLMDINELAAHLGVAPRHVRRLVAERRIPFIKWGHLLRFDPGDVAAWLEEARVEGRP